MNSKSSRKSHLSFKNEGKKRQEHQVNTNKSKHNKSVGSPHKKHGRERVRFTEDAAENTSLLRSSSSNLDSSTFARETTPDRILEVVEKDTPVVERLGEVAEFRRLYAKPQRLSIAQYTGGEVALGPMEYFLKHVLPPIRSEFDIDKIVEYCAKNKALSWNSRTKKYSWKSFSLRSKCRKDHETEVYNKPLVEIFDIITKAALETQKTKSEHSAINVTCYAHADGNKATWALKESMIKPDAHLFLKGSDDSYPKKYNGKHWYNSAFIFQFKKSTRSEDEKYDNVMQTLHSLLHCASVDPCRRFTLGATIEGRRMRLWFYSRSIIICSEDFDFVAEPETMIKVALSLIFAEKADLGWDPTLSAKYDGKQRLFDIEVSGKHYKSSSTNIISETKADGIFTSATRIYKAFAEDDEEEKTPVIIKDYWPSEKYETEDVIQRIIMEDIKDPADREFLENMTLTPIASGRVKVGDQEDHTEGTILRGKGPEARYQIHLPNSKFGSKSGSTKGSEGFKKRTDGQAQQLAHELMKNRRSIDIQRWHYRIVFKEYAVPYHKLRNLNDMILVLKCTLEALFVIHKAGYIHRDLSPDNLYLYTDLITGEKRGLVGDLEFAKKPGTANRCMIRTGTADCMAAELLYRQYLFDETTHAEVSSDHEGFDGTDADNPDKISYRENESTRIWANYLHDLESIWWIVIWTIFTFQEASFVEKNSKEYEKIREQQESVGAQLFSGSMEKLTRKSFLVDQIDFISFMKKAPDNLLGLKAFAYDFRNILVRRYKKEESTRSDPILFKLTDRKPVHDRILDILNTRLPREKHNIRIATIQRQPEAEKVRPKRSTYDNEDEIEQPVKKRRLVQKAKKTNLARVPPGSGQAANDQPEVEVETEGMILRSGLRCRRSNDILHPRGHDSEY